MPGLQFQFLSAVKTISGIGFLICLLLKVVLHIYLDFTGKRVSGLAIYLYAPSVFFKKYKAAWLNEKTGTIFFCNACLYTFYFLLAVNVTVGVLMLLVR